MLVCMIRYGSLNLHTASRGGAKWMSDDGQIWHCPKALGGCDMENQILGFAIRILEAKPFELGSYFFRRS